VSRLRDQRGMTLPEVLMTLTIGVLLSLGALALVETTMRRSGEVSARVETLQRGRTAMDLITRQLRSQICLGNAPARAITAATQTSVTFYAYMGDPSTKGSQVSPSATAKPIIPERRQLSFENGAIVERRWVGTPNSSSPLGYTFPSSPTATRTLLTPVALVETGDPSVQPALFRYYAYDPSTVDANVPLVGASLNDMQTRQIARIEISYRALPSRARPDNRASTVLQNAVTSRTVDPNDPDKLIPCQ
jgi:prepilin-type N-terminal cleavage/methylation domain-containing protein